MSLRDSDQILDEACRAYWETLNEDSPWETLDYATKTSVRTALVPVVASVAQTSSIYYPFSDAIIQSMSRDTYMHKQIELAGKNIEDSMFPESWTYDLLARIFDQYIRYTEQQ